MERRDFLATAGAIGVSGLSGCLFQGSQSIRTIRSQPATVPQFVFERTVFNKHTLSGIESVESVDYRGEQSEVKYSEWVSEYSTFEDSADVFWVRTYPKRKIGSETLRPRNIQSVEQALEQTETPWNKWVVESEAREYDVSVLEKNISVDEYAGAISDPNLGTVNSRFFFSKIENKADVLVCFGSVSESSNNYDDYLSMLQSVVHPGKEEGQGVVETDNSENQTDSA